MDFEIRGLLVKSFDKYPENSKQPSKIQQLELDLLNCILDPDFQDLDKLLVRKVNNAKNLPNKKRSTNILVLS